jgi:type I restriction enzyme, S subunit
MPTEWTRRSLESVGITLLDCLHKTPEEDPSGTHRYVAIPQMNGGRLNIAEARRISEEAFVEWTKNADPLPHDVVLSRRCNPGETAYVAPGERFAVGQNLVILRADGKSVFPPFLRWLVRSPEWWLQVGKFINVGAVFDSLKCREIPKFALPIPPLAEQRAIAGVLGALDDKIEQNRRTARALERLARAIFRAWFVDFEPVKAKAAGATTFPSMPQSVYDALPTRFVDSDIGPVPKGWEVKALDNVANFLNGLALQKYPPRGDRTDLPVIKIAQLRKGSTEGADASNDSIDEKYKIRDGDLLFSWSGTLEALFWFGGQGALNQHLFKVTSTGYPQWLVYEWIQQHLSEFRLIAASKATTMGHIKRGHLSQALVTVPPMDVLTGGDQILSPLFETHANMQLESRKLVELRDYLLPKLLSGAIRVGEAERLHAAVA